MEYINKENVIDIIDNSADIQEVKSCVFMLENADVIERSKINNAIEEIEKEIKENDLNVIEYADAEWILKDFVYGAIDRLKRNIGEQ